MKSRLILGLALLVCLAGGSGTAKAQGWGFGGGGYWYGGPWYNAYGLDNMPYYALHPPVYYSYPVPRTYGYSPFAYPPTVRTPDLKFYRPQTVRNPYMRGSEASTSSDDNMASTGPLRMRNPFYHAEQPERLSQQIPLAPRPEEP